MNIGKLTSLALTVWMTGCAATPPERAGGRDVRRSVAGLLDACRRQQEPERVTDLIGNGDPALVLRILTRAIGRTKLDPRYGMLHYCIAQNSRAYCWDHDTDVYLPLLLQLVRADTTALSFRRTAANGIRQLAEKGVVSKQYLPSLLQFQSDDDEWVRRYIVEATRSIRKHDGEPTSRVDGTRQTAPVTRTVLQTKRKKWDQRSN